MVGPAQLRSWRRRLALSEEQCRARHTAFCAKYPTGLMSKEDFMAAASAYLPSSELDRFADNTFKLFDEDRDGMLDFGEFALAASGQETAGADCRERLVWMFDRLYDQDLKVDSREGEEVLATLLEMELVQPTSSKRHARRVIEDLKIVRGGLINKDEFIEAALKSQVLFNIITSAYEANNS